MKFDPQTLPGDVAPCHALIAELALKLESQSREVRLLRHELEKLLRWRYGPKRERVDENQLFLFAAEVLAAAAREAQAEPAAEGPTPPRPGHGRKPLPRGLERRRVEYDLEERTCPECRETLRPIGEEVSERLEYVPASLYVIEEVCRKYACPKGCTVVTASKPMQTGQLDVLRKRQRRPDGRHPDQLHNDLQAARHRSLRLSARYLRTNQRP